MAFATPTQTIPLREGADGALRVGDSNVLLELVVRAFQDGATPEAIVQRYSTVSLSDAYAVVAYYLRNRQTIEGYLAQREDQAESVRQRLENHQKDLHAIRARLLSRRQH